MNERLSHVKISFDLLVINTHAKSILLSSRAQDDNKKLVHLGVECDFKPYRPALFNYRRLLRSVLTPNFDMDWSLVHLYLEILTFDLAVPRRLEPTRVSSQPRIYSLPWNQISQEPLELPVNLKTVTTEVNNIVKTTNYNLSWASFWYFFQQYAWSFIAASFSGIIYIHKNISHLLLTDTCRYAFLWPCLMPSPDRVRQRQSCHSHGHIPSLENYSQHGQFNGSKDRQST